MKKISFVLALCMIMSLFAGVVSAKVDYEINVTFSAVDMETGELLPMLMNENGERLETYSVNYNFEEFDESGEFITGSIPELVNYKDNETGKVYVFDHWNDDPDEFLISEDKEFIAYCKADESANEQFIVNFKAVDMDTNKPVNELTWKQTGGSGSSLISIIVNADYVLTEKDIPYFDFPAPGTVVVETFDHWDNEPLSAKITEDTEFTAYFKKEDFTKINVTFSAVDMETGELLPMLMNENGERLEKYSYSVNLDFEEIYMGTEFISENIPELVNYKDNETGKVYVFDHWNDDPNEFLISEDKEFIAYCKADENANAQCIVKFSAVNMNTNKSGDLLSLGEEKGKPTINVIVDFGHTLTENEIPKFGPIEPGTLVRFDHWDVEPNGTQINEDTEFKAYYVSKFYVTFESEEADIGSVQIVEYGQAAEAPELPELEGYVCFGWDKDLSCITESILVTARYYKYGDSDMNKEVDSADATVILRYVAKLDEFTDEQKIVADTNIDKVIDASDATNVLRVVAGLED